ncbi:4-hydroxy-tetrahydrodipicolinate synthase [Melghiribacillus thermohalophilus]|uniref:4-hydroxy-tetrahydrodipicolinate synthase n=1 Tax=Melghiribacillus thermohalophilus TaxID=1324956 RepID=A0A4R3NBA6_9BACI|nr:4-hydroxy-tetrahydrodipicolinate synthase [Melghiribacillus thermohalophilus]TCT26714.1 4-hydroxy-tetrahydrodipicolinate synthase [Melghiribacillus thermohalophilus]
MNFGKVLTAMVTPFNDENELDLNRTEKLVEHLLENGSDGLVVAGTTGESPTLSYDEKKQLFSKVVDVVNGRVPVIAGTGSNHTNGSISITKMAEETGVDGIMLVSPYYNKPDQRGLYAHFKTVAESTKLPVMLYNIPGRSAVNMDVETIVKLSEVPNIVAVKEASGDLDAMAEIIESTPEDFDLYSGDDGLTLPVMAIGGTGIVSVASHVIGNEMQEMLKLFESGKIQEAAKLHRKLLPVMKGMFMAPSPSPVKAALNLKGIETGGVRLPLLPLKDEQKNQIKSLLERV